MLVTGDKLSKATRELVLRAYVYRPTHENNYPKHNPLRMRVPATSDEQWLKEHAFYVTKNGNLDNRFDHCEPAFMVQEENEDE